MKLPGFLLALLFTATTLSAGEEFDYKAEFALGLERTQTTISKPQLILVLGPLACDETGFSEGKEITRHVPVCTAYDAIYAKQIGTIFGSNNAVGQTSGITFENNQNMQLLLYRAGSADPILRIVGNQNIYLSQFPLKAGDILVVTPVPAKK